MGDRPHDKIRVVQGRERHEKHSVRERAAQRAGHLDRQAGLANPRRAGECEQPHRSTAFALLFSFVQGALAALLSLALGGLAQQYGLRPVMLGMVTIPYAINAVFWFVFYKVYPRDSARMQDSSRSSRPPARTDRRRARRRSPANRSDKMTR